MLIGTIVAYYGDLKDLKGSNWLPCDGEEIPDGKEYAKLRNWFLDHPVKGATAGHLPNLNGNHQFLRGADNDQRPNDPTTPWNENTLGMVGGTETISADGKHMHKKISPGEHLKRGADLGYHMQEEPAHDHGGNNRPPYLNVYYIMKAK